jgi:hypothetical protein
MKGERLFVERQTELLEHLAEEQDITIIVIRISHYNMIPFPEIRKSIALRN